MSAKPCHLCKFFIPRRYNRIGQCSRFVVYRGRGKLIHQFADEARANEKECGKNAKYWISKSPLLPEDGDEDEL